MAFSLSVAEVLPSKYSKGIFLIHLKRDDEAIQVY
jgi:hypothetical protein